MIFDTHLHLIDLNRLTYPWLAEAEALRRDASYHQYASTARRLGITGAMHMEVDVADADREAETDMILELMREPGSLLQGAISSCRPEEKDFPEFLDRQLLRPEVKGLRRVLHVVPDAVSQSTSFRDHVKRLSGTGLTFDLCVLARQLPLAMELVDHCPDVTFVLDHCGVPDVKAKVFSSWADSIATLAHRPNVMAKISGVVAYGDLENWTLDDIRPFVEHTIDCFGWDRVLWGSDSPVCTLAGHLETWVAASHAILQPCSNDERSRLFRGNACRLWNFAA